MDTNTQPRDVGHGYNCACGGHSIENCRKGRDCTATQAPTGLSPNLRKFRVFYLHSRTPFDCEARSTYAAQELAVAHYAARPEHRRRRVKGHDMSVVLADVPVSTVL